MTTAEAALRQLLADIEACRAFLDNCDGEIPPLMGSPKLRLDYLEKLARDGLAVPENGWFSAPVDWVCTAEVSGNSIECCGKPALYSDGEEQGACEEHAAKMGVRD